MHIISSTRHLVQAALLNLTLARASLCNSSSHSLPAGNGLSSPQAPHKRPLDPHLLA